MQVQIPPEKVRRAILRTDISQMIGFSHEQFLSESLDLSTFPQFLVSTLNSGLDAEVERKENIKKVNRWCKRNVGIPRFPSSPQTDKNGQYSFIYLQVVANEFFLYDYHVSRLVVEEMVQNGLLVYFGEIPYLGVKHKAWTTPRNVETVTIGI